MGLTGTRLVRFRCASCRRVAGVLDRDGDRLWLRFGRRTKMRGETPTEALAWEYGTSTKAPRQGVAPDGALIVDQRWEHELWDPRRTDDPPSVPSTWAEVEEITRATGKPYRSPPWTFERCRLETLTCARCAEVGAWPERDVLTEAMDEAERSSRPVTLQLGIHPRRSGPG